MSISTTPAQPQLEVRVHERTPTTAVITAAGEIDRDSCAEIRRCITAELGPRRRVVLDLSAVTFLDSAGIRMLLTCHQEAQAHGDRIEIGQAHEVVRQVLAVCGVADLFEPQAA